ncbi:hypothetical protein [Brevundimonas sp. Root1423]|uniref:hypothetical protein n=1 Tax=Brevundimonas sp. Root1423 TaxID=1736462 RepID=UPI0006F72CE9|nr:hypothetical protein [Brevundimonas sp. Root1423]KQY75364.1 hypothetical protein ASD25_12580 [Brevundimonas sp. Root1423]
MALIPEENGQAEMMDLKSLILHELLTDDSSSSCEQDCERIRHQYEAADAGRKAVLDDVFISLTGYGLNTLIDKAAW